MQKNLVAVIYASMYTRLVRNSYRMTRSWELSEDIVQEAFIRLIRYSQGREINLDHLRPLIYVITRNLTLNALRRDRKISMVPSSVKALDVFVDTREKTGVDSLISDIHDGLPLEYRELFRLKYVEQLSTLDISRVLAVCDRTVRRKLGGLRRYIKDHMAL